MQLNPAAEQEVLDPTFDWDGESDNDLDALDLIEDIPTGVIRTHQSARCWAVCLRLL